MKVIFIASPTAAPYYLAYNIGEQADIEDAVAKDLIQQNIATPVAQPPHQTAETAISKQAKKAEKR